MSTPKIKDKESVLIARNLTGVQGKVVTVLLIAFSLFEIWYNSFGVIPGVFKNAVHLGFLLVLTFLLFPASKKSPTDRFTWWDIFLASLGAVVGLYIVFFYNDLHLVRNSIANGRDFFFAILAIVMVLVAARRAIGPLIPILSIIFLLYAKYGPYFPGLFGHAGLSWERILYRMYLTYEGIFGITLTVSATYIFIFILFGAFLNVSGAANFFNDLALAIAGKKRGGPAQVAVLSSAMMGTLSGSAVANVATTGTFTIPLMKRIGYKPYFAGAVEAAASTGGMIMPPIMGAAAFIMSSFLGVPYLTIMAAAILPSLLYYAGIIIMVDIEAKKLGLKGLPADQLPTLKDVLRKQGVLVLPILVIIYTLIAGKTPLFAGFAGIISTIIASWVAKGANRIGVKEALKAMEDGARGALIVGMACAACGFIVGVAGMTGVGSVIAHNIIKISGGTIFFALVLVMFACIFLSMGLPSTALYIVVAVTAAPALVKAGVLPLAAHFFVFWFGALSNVTPPVALASYTAAAIAGDDPMKTGWQGLKLTLAGFLIPFIFVYSPILLMQNFTLFKAGLAFITGIIGVFSLAIAAENYYAKKLSYFERFVFFAGALLLIKPGLYTDLPGLIIVGAAFIFHNISARKKAKNLTEVI
ncbi:MAG: TRAP transporter permease [Bacillota bacterium]